MNKIICDICGTTYPETADCCPICGFARDSSEDMLADDLLADDLLDDGAMGLGDPFTARKKEIFDYDEVNAEPEEEEYEDEDEEDEEEYDDAEEEEEAPRHNTLLVILLTILITGLLIVAGFVFVRFFLMNKKADEAAPVQTVSVMETLPAETTEPSVPCETLILSSGNVAEMNAEGQHFLLHVKPMPENTTDSIIYTSADESIATVTEDGRITAVSEGETKIYISCGRISIECPVIIRYVEETVPPTTEVPVETAAVEESTPVVEAVDPDQPDTPPASVPVSSEINTGITLKLKKKDIKLGVYLSFTLELDCELEQNEVQWSSEHPYIAKVDENGVVTAVKSGTTAITATYGDQTATCIVRCG